MVIMLSKFSYFGNEISAEASTLGLKPCEVPGGRLFPDACDFGFTIESDQTGQSYIFLLDEERSNQDAWEYVPYDETCPVRMATIFND